MPTHSLTGKTVLVTGAGGGVGRAVSEAFAHEGAKLVLIGRQESELEQTAAPIRDRGGEVLT